MLSISHPPYSLAQESPQPPRSSEASTVDQKTFEGARAQLIEIEEEGPKIELAPKAEKPVKQAPVKFFVREILFEGNHALTRKELEPFLGPYQGRELTLSEAAELADQIEQEYRRRGYITTSVFVPPQKIEDQRLILEILEGKMGKLYIEANRWFSEKTIRRYWTLEQGELLRYQELQKSLRRINEHPDRSVQALLRPGEEKGTTDVHLKVKDQFPLHAGFQFDNEGTRSTGRERLGFTVRHNNWIIPDSIFLGGTFFGKDFGSLFFQYLVPLTGFGTKFLWSFSHSQVTPGREFKGSDIHGTSTTFSGALRQTLWERENLTAIASLGFDLKDSRTRDTSGTRRRDRLRVLRPGIDVNQRDARGNSRLSGDFSFGLQGLGALGDNNPFASRAGAPSDFIKFEASALRNQTLPLGTEVMAKVGFQVSPDKLTPQEEFYLGGANTVRGYPEGDYLGDQGVLFNFEFLFPIFRKTIQGVVFFDQAYGRLRGASPDEVDQRHLIGLGGGLRIRLKRHIFARLEWAHALGDEPLTESDHTRFHFQLSAEI